MGNSAKRDIAAAEIALRQSKALEMRKAGASYDQIATALGMANRSVAWQSVRSAIKTVIREPAQEVLDLELSRLDIMMMGCWPKARTGDLQTIDRVLRIMDRRSTYLGLDAPKTMHFDLSKLTDDQLKEIVGRTAEAVADAGASGAEQEIEQEGFVMERIFGKFEGHPSRRESDPSALLPETDSTEE